MKKYLTRYTIALVLSLFLNIIFISIIFKWSYYPDDFKFIVGITEIIGIIVAVATYIRSKNKDQFNYTMKIITGIQSSIAQISSKNAFNEEFIKSKKNIRDELSRLTLTNVLLYFKKKHKKIPADIDLIRKHIGDNLSKSYNGYLNNKAKFRVISEIMVKLNQYAIYIISKQVNTDLVESEVKLSLAKFLTSYDDFFQKYIKKSNGGSVHLNNLHLLMKLWDIH